MITRDAQTVRLSRCAVTDPPAHRRRDLQTVDGKESDGLRRSLSGRRAASWRLLGLHPVGGRRQPRQLTSRPAVVGRPVASSRSFPLSERPTARGPHSRASLDHSGQVPPPCGHALGPTARPMVNCKGRMRSPRKSATQEICCYCREVGAHLIVPLHFCSLAFVPKLTCSSLALFRLLCIAFVCRVACL